jgi:hypothetical protein
MMPSRNFNNGVLLDEAGAVLAHVVGHVWKRTDRQGRTEWGGFLFSSRGDIFTFTAGSYKLRLNDVAYNIEVSNVRVSARPVRTGSSADFLGEGAPPI